MQVITLVDEERVELHTLTVDESSDLSRRQLLVRHVRSLGPIGMPSADDPLQAALIVNTAQRAEADVAVYDKITAEVDRADAELSRVIADTPAAVLTSLMPQ